MPTLWKHVMFAFSKLNDEKSDIKLWDMWRFAFTQQ